jgi:hypothetical protein
LRHLPVWQARPPPAGYEALAHSRPCDRPEAGEQAWVEPSLDFPAASNRPAASPKADKARPAGAARDTVPAEEECHGPQLGGLAVNSRLEAARIPDAEAHWKPAVPAAETARADVRCSSRFPRAVG